MTELSKPVEKKTAGDNPFTSLFVELFEYISVVGTEMVHKGRANKAMFMHAALRQLDEYPGGADSKKVVIFFRMDYAPPLREAFKAACIAKGVREADFREIDTLDALISYLNSRGARQIKRVDIFSHGSLGVLGFGMGTGLDDRMNMTVEGARRLSPAPFSIDAKIYSYACQTANGVGKNLDARLNSSLARAISDAAQVEVYAYMRKTNYDGVLGDSAMRQDYYEATDNPKKWQDPIDAVSLTEAEKKRAEQLKGSLISREAEAQKYKLDADFDPKGGLLPVRVDSVPEDVPNSQYFFVPSSKRKDKKAAK